MSLDTICALAAAAIGLVTSALAARYALTTRR